MTDRLLCDLECFSSSEHLGQMYTGFGILSKKKLVKISLKKIKDYKTYGMLFLKVTLNNRLKLFYDLEDHDIINQKHLNECDFYFKRSFDEVKHRSIEQGSKIFPLGFNYSVADKSDFLVKRTAWDLTNDFKINKIYPLLVKSWQRRFSKVKDFETYPRFTTNPNIIFFARLWEPDKTKRDELREERNYINSIRAQCIAKLKKKYRNNFVGGITPTNFALKEYAEIVVDKNVTKKRNYLKLLHESDICIATMGLRRSNGWKIAEYIGASKAIVSEKLCYQPTGNFEKNKNYFEFKSVDECMLQVEKLFNNHELIYEMKKANFNYYHSYLRPDILVWNSLQRAIIESNR